MGIRRRHLLGGSLAVAGLLAVGPAAFGRELTLGRGTDIAVRSAKVFTAGSTRIMVYRRTAAKFSAFVATCPFDQTPLKRAHVRPRKITNLKRRRITCPNDKSVFKAGNGKRISGPTTQALERLPIKVVNGFLVATVAASASPAPSPPPTSSDQLIESSKVPVGGGVKVRSSVGMLMIVQPTAGNFAAFSAICTHAGCTVSRATAQAIVCTCHGSEFSTGNGAVLKGPASSPLRRYGIVERSGGLFLS
jgi:nitrite reductase/ring-hydroxylating ferredoxin subunit